MINPEALISILLELKNMDGTDGLNGSPDLKIHGILWEDLQFKKMQEMQIGGETELSSYGLVLVISILPPMTSVSTVVITGTLFKILITEMNLLIGSSYITVIHTNYNKQLDMLDSKAEGNKKLISMI